MLFFSLSNADVKFAKLEKLIQRSYIAAKALSTTRRVKLVNKRKFAKEGFDENSETYVMYVATLEAMTIYPFWAAQISILQQDKAFIKIPLEQSDYADIFLADLAIELPKNTDMNKHALELIKENQPPYRLIYVFSPVE